MEEIKLAQQKDKLLIGHGSTNVYVAEEILGKNTFAKIIDPDLYVSGLITRGILCTTLGEEKGSIVLLNRGKIEEPAPTMGEILRDFGPDSVFIKGANAVDPEGNVSVFVAHPEGGTIGWAIGNILARGIRLIVPVGLEKLVPSVKTAVSMCGQMRFDYFQGLRVGMIPLAGALVVTEIEALKMLTGVNSYHVGSGGSSGSEGSITLVAEGESGPVKKTISLLESIKGEPALAPRKGICAGCLPKSPAQPQGYEMKGGLEHCPYQGKSEEELPSYLKNR
jgi:hypothetical protein